MVRVVGEAVIQALNSDVMINFFFEKIYRNTPGRIKKNKVNSGKRNIR